MSANTGLGLGLGLGLVVCSAVVFLSIVSDAEDTSSSMETIACFNTIFEISCDETAGGEMLIFESAHYGRNDTRGAVKCKVPYSQACDLDVQNPLSKTCGGRRRCSLAINTAFFGDPCGYDEFLVVSYRCVPVASIMTGMCQQQHQPTTPSSGLEDAVALATSLRLVERGYISSPSYPGRYDMDVDCQWTVTVQPRQTIRITLYDFELDVKTDGLCRESVEIHQVSAMTSSRVFRDCGSLGQQVVDVESNKAIIKFTTGQWSLAQRGFVLSFEAVGSGCPLITNGHVIYYVTDSGLLYVNVTCSKDAFQSAHCLGSVWSSAVECVQEKSVVAVSSISTVSFQHAVSYGNTQIQSAGSATVNPPLLVVGLAVSASAALVTFCITGCLFVICYRRRCSVKRRPRANGGSDVTKNLHQETTILRGPVVDQDLSTSLLTPTSLHPTQSIVPADRCRVPPDSAQDSDDDVSIPCPDVIPNNMAVMSHRDGHVTWLAPELSTVFVETEQCCKLRSLIDSDKCCACRHNNRQFIPRPLYHIDTIVSPNDVT